MTKSTLRQFIEHAAKQAAKIFEKNGQLLPMYHAVDSAGKDLIFPSPSADKDKAVAIVRKVLAEAGATRVAYMDEAWSIDNREAGDVDVEEIYRSGRSISEHPDRIEIIMISAEDASEGIIMAHRKIFRHGDRAVLGKLEILEGGGLEGRMVGLLPRSPATKH
jgi:hypothetical protein